MNTKRWSGFRAIRRYLYVLSLIQSRKIISKLFCHHLWSTRFLSKTIGNHKCLIYRLCLQQMACHLCTKLASTLGSQKLVAVGFVWKYGTPKCSKAYGWSSAPLNLQFWWCCPIFRRCQLACSDVNLKLSTSSTSMPVHVLGEEAEQKPEEPAMATKTV